MLDKLHQLEIDNSLTQWKPEYSELDVFMQHSCGDNKWHEVVNSYIKLKQQLLQQLNEQVRPHLTDDEWIMLLIELNCCQDILQYLPEQQFDYPNW